MSRKNTPKTKFEENPFPQQKNYFTSFFYLLCLYIDTKNLLGSVNALRRILRVYRFAMAASANGGDLYLKRTFV